MTEERKLWLSICNNDLKKLEACAESIQTEIQRSVFLNWSEKVKWNIIFKLDKATRWGHSLHSGEVSYIISVYQQRVREMMLE